jgi:hypothetical protein
VRANLVLPLGRNGTKKSLRRSRLSGKMTFQE